MTLFAAEPNKMHILRWQRWSEELGERFYLCTQNVDDLHERAGSHRVHHMHGSLFASRCEECGLPFPDKNSMRMRPSNMRNVRCARPAAHRMVRGNPFRDGRNLR